MFQRSRHGNNPNPIGARERVDSLRALTHAGPDAGLDAGPAGLDTAPGGERGTPADVVAGADPDAEIDADIDAAAAADSEAARAAPTGWVPESSPDDNAVPQQRQSGWSAGLANAGPWGELAEKWVPEPLREARMSPGRRGAIALVVVAALAAVVTAVSLWWTKPEPTPVGSAMPISLADGSDGDAGSGSHGDTDIDGGPDSDAALLRQLPDASHAAEPAPASQGSHAAVTTSSAPRATGPILVSVTGRIRHPGVVTVPADARVADAIAAAGGVLDVADLTGLNLAAHLSDGDSVVVADPGQSMLQAETTSAPPAAAGASDSGGDSAVMVNINTADAVDLEQLSGVGPATAAKILAYRSEHGQFSDIQQLQAVSGIGPATYERLAPHITV